MSKEMDDLLRRNQNPPVNECMLTYAHDPHEWWYTSSGGGHMLSEITEDDLRTEKGLKKHRCPGLKARTSIFNDDECNAAGCHKEDTHTLTTLVSADSIFPETEQEVRYCLDHALYFAAWLPYCYPNRYTLVSIMPPASELFKDL